MIIETLGNFAGGFFITFVLCIPLMLIKTKVLKQT